MDIVPFGIIMGKGYYWQRVFSFYFYAQKPAFNP